MTEFSDALRQTFAPTGTLRVIDEAFMQIRQAMGLHPCRGPDANQWLNAFIERLKSQGFIQHALTFHGIAGVSVAPPV